MSGVAVPHRDELGLYLRSLWGVSPVLLPTVGDDAVTPAWSNLGLHLPLAAPAGDARRWYRAAGAHATAHAIYSQERFEGRSLKPVTRALVGLLEDARVEWLACRELPGLRALWQAEQAAAPPDGGTDFESLMRRLARVLLDPGRLDVHPWIVKARAMFFADPAGTVLQLRTAQGVSAAASRLGHDIGQMRLAFNPRLHVPWPSYRDDNAALWNDTGPARALSGEAVAGARAAPHLSPREEEAGAPAASVHRYPEWDRLISRHRPGWCTVHETQWPRAAMAASHPPLDGTGDADSRRQRLRRQPDGDALDLEAAVQARVDRRVGRMPDERIHAAWRRVPSDAREFWLLDLSASTQGVQWTGACLWASSAASRLASGLGACAIAGFRSAGRHAVEVVSIKAFDEPWSAEAASRMQALQPGGSTRLGAALRHACRRLMETAPGRPARRRLVVVSDGDPHDIDVHDDRYLVEDATRAVADARRLGIEVVGWAFDGASLAPMRRIFGAAWVRRMPQGDVRPPVPGASRRSGTQSLASGPAPSSPSFGGVASIR